MHALKEKTAVVMGGAAGIGLETCRRLVKAGCAVTLWDVNAAGLTRVRKELSRGGAKIFAYRCDVTKRARVSELARRAVKDMGRGSPASPDCFSPGSAAMTRWQKRSWSTP